ncbi:MFS transporter [Cumulibacter manganitolerans]|uniref:MFS transporter n=1 Tax=Cumulibacter manganitolerans TaxID=1884992 RepID=UPI00188628CC|nr:MFS transporter [Cumulibacter manganitolerans]
MSTAADSPTRAPLAVAAAAFVSSLDRFATGPMIVLIAADLHTSLAVAATFVAGGYFLAYGVFQPVWGLLSDHIGRSRTMLLTLVIAGVAGLVSAFSPSITLLAVARTVAGACFGAIAPASITFVGDTVGPAHRQRALSDLLAVTATGVAVSTALAGWLAHLVSWRAVFGLTAVVAGLCALGLRGISEPRRGGVSGIAAHLGVVLRDRWALLVFALAFVEGGVVLGMLTYLPAALSTTRGVDAGAAGLAVAAYGVGALGFSRLVSRLTGHRPMWLLGAVGGTAMLLAFAAVTATITLVTVIAGALLLGCGWAFLHSSLQTWAVSVVPAARGTAVALFAASLFVGSSLSTALAAPYAGAGRFTLVFAVAGAVAVPLTAAAALGMRRYAARR